MMVEVVVMLHVVRCGFINFHRCMTMAMTTTGQHGDTGDDGGDTFEGANFPCNKKSD